MVQKEGSRKQQFFFLTDEMSNVKKILTFRVTMAGLTSPVKKINEPC